MHQQESEFVRLVMPKASKKETYEATRRWFSLLHTLNRIVEEREARRRDSKHALKLQRDTLIPMKCAFCEDAAIKERVTIKNKLAFAFPTNTPIVIGHTLICPTRHVATLSELYPRELEAILSLRDSLMRAMKKAFRANGFNFAWNEGLVAGQTVPHLHLHVVPRKSGDAGIYEYEPRKFLYRPGSREESPDAELRAVARLIAQNIA